MKKIYIFISSILCFFAFVSCDSKILSFYKDCADNKVEAVREKITKDPTLTITPLSEKDAETFASYAYLDTNSSYFNLPIEIAIKNGHKDVMRILYMEMNKSGYKFDTNNELSGKLLEYAVKENNIDMLKELLSINCDSDVYLNDSNNTIPAVLFNEGKYELAEEFFKRDGVCIGRNVSPRDFMNIWDDYQQNGNVEKLLLLAKYVDFSDFVNVSFSRTIEVTKPRMYGDDVLFVQETLYNLDIIDNYNDVDGYYGPKSEGAVQTFQNIFRLPVTGIVDETTFDLICRVSSLYEIVLRVEII